MTVRACVSRECAARRQVRSCSLFNYGRVDYDHYYSVSLSTLFGNAAWDRSSSYTRMHYARCRRIRYYSSHRS